MKAMAWIRNWYMKVPAMTWLWIGCIVIGLSTVLQTITIYQPSYLLSTVAQVFAGFGIIFTIVQAYRSARDFKQEQKRTNAVAQNTAIRHTELRISSNLNKAPDSMPDSH
jgi:hypothetical protein